MTGVDSENQVRRVLDAVINVASHLSLPDVLQRVVESSCQLVNARYGALSVVSGDSSGALFTVDRLPRNGNPECPLPTELTSHDWFTENFQPLRLAAIAKNPQSFGFSTTQQPLSSFLGVPIRVRGVAFANLYLTAKNDAHDFTEADIDVISALAAAAGIAIDNARLFDETHRREMWLEATTQIGAALLGGQDSKHALSLIAERARTVAGAQFSALALPTDDNDELVLDVVDGFGAEFLAGLHIGISDSLCGRVYTTGRAEVIDHASEHTPCWAGQQETGSVGPMLVVPLASGHAILGVLTVANPVGARPFRPAELRMAENFAGHAALAIEIARAQEDRQRLAVYEDRDRIAQDLHDLVIQRLFAIGLGLQGISRLITKQELSNRVLNFAHDLDDTIGEIRRTIFSLQTPHDEPISLRAQVLRACTEAADALGFEPHLRMEGPLDLMVPTELYPHILATLRESLSNVAQHAAARTVEVLIRTDRSSEQCELAVTDDGKGMPQVINHRSGLVNIADRAERLGGGYYLESNPGAGTRLVWWIPLHPALKD